MFICLCWVQQVGWRGGIAWGLPPRRAVLIQHLPCDLQGVGDKSVAEMRRADRRKGSRMFTFLLEVKNQLMRIMESVNAGKGITWGQVAKGPRQLKQDSECWQSHLTNASNAAAHRSGSGTVASQSS